MKIGNHWNRFLTCAMNYSVSLEIFKSWLAFSPPESYTFVKLQLLDQSQEFIYSAESTSTGSLAFQTRQVTFWGGICGRMVAQGQHRAQDSCGEDVVFISPAFLHHTKGEAEGILSCSTDAPVCKWKIKPTPVPGLKAVSRLHAAC